jgi:DNA-binding NarL/FixJ family response regulator
MMPSSKKRILIADSHPTMTASVRLLLGNIFDVTVMVADVQSLSDAVVRSDFDLVIANLSIPRISNDNVVSLVKRLRPDIRIIVLSVHDDPAVISECRSAGADGIVLMREAVNDLIPAVDAILRGDSYVSPSLNAGETGKRTEERHEKH